MKIIYCAGEQARVVIDILRQSNRDDDAVLLDDDPAKQGREVAGIPVRGGSEGLASFDPATDEVLVAYGSEPGVRLDIAADLREAGFDFFSALHPDTTTSETASIGDGVMLNAGSYVGPGVEIADFALVDSLVNLSHDVTVRAGATITPHATLAGGVTVGSDAYVGAGSTVRDHVTLGEGSVVGAGAVVVDDVPADTTVVGVPAEPLEGGE